MTHSLSVGVLAGAAISLWNVMTMLQPVSYRTWDIGRGILFVGFAFALTALAGSGSRRSAVSRFGSVALACLAAAAVTLTTYVISTRDFAHWIVQLPEYLHDYTYHGYTSPEIYLSTHYSELLGLQLFTWGIGVVGLLVVTGTAGWCLGRFWRQPRAA